MYAFAGTGAGFGGAGGMLGGRAWCTSTPREVTGGYFEIRIVMAQPFT
jgi:hypothetical protein